MKKIADKIKEFAEWGDIHNEDCCVNFPEDSRACDVGTRELGCCDNMMALEKFCKKLVEMVVEKLSYDITFDGDEQRKAGVELYLNSLNEELN